MRVRQTQRHVGHPAEPAVHLHDAVHLRRQDSPLRVQRRVDGLDDVEVDLVRRVLDAVRAPRQRQRLRGVLIAHEHALMPEDLRRDAIHEARRRDERLEAAGVRVHRDAAVEHLVQELVQRHVVFLWGGGG